MIVAAAVAVVVFVVVVVVCCLLFVVCCLLFVVCCVLFVVCCLLLLSLSLSLSSSSSLLFVVVVVVVALAVTPAVPCSFFLSLVVAENRQIGFASTFVSKFSEPKTPKIPIYIVCASEAQNHGIYDVVCFWLQKPRYLQLFLACAWQKHCYFT